MLPVIKPDTIKILSDAIAAVCPIVGVSVGDWTDKTTWRIDFAASATPAQQQAAQQVVTNFDPTSTANNPVWLDTDILLSRLTTAEYTAIIQAIQQRLQLNDGQLSLWLDRARAKTKINLNSTQTQQAETFLINNNIMTAARVAVVFAP